MEHLQEIRYWIIASSCLLAAAAMTFCFGAWVRTSPGLLRFSRTLNHQIRSLTLSSKLVAVVFLSVCITYGGGKARVAESSNPPPARVIVVTDGGHTRQLDGEEALAHRLTTNQFLSCFALFQTLTNASFALSVPSNAVLHAPWTRYGVAEDTLWLPACAAEPGDAAGRPATNWSFILGTNQVDGLHVSSSGTISFGWPKGSPRAREMPDGSSLDFLAPLQTDIGIVPPVGRFWHAPTPSNSLLLTWQDVYANRDTNYPISFQSELFANGDFTFRYDFSRLSTPDARLTGTNFVVGAQNSGGGETYAFGDTNLLFNGLELRWRAFGLLDPGIDDHDGDGLSTYDEVMLYGTDPRRFDTDGDGLSDYDEVHGSTNPLNPDTDGDGIPDGMTAAEWQSNALFAPGTNKRTITLHRSTAIPAFATAVLRFGSLPIILSAAESWTIHVPTGTVHMAELVTTGNPAVGLTLTAEAGIFLDNPDGVIQQSSLDDAGASRSGFISLSGASFPGNSGVSGGSFYIFSPGVHILPFTVLLHSEEWVDLMCSVHPSNATTTATLPSWSVSYEAAGHGITFTPETGLSTTVYWPLSSGLDAIVVMAELTDTQGGTITAYRTLTRCTANEPLHWTSGTDNFSPHLGEIATFGFGAGCGHTSEYVGQWLEIEVSRETVDGLQHVAWLDADPESAGSQRRRQIPWGWQSSSVAWDGVASESVAEAVSPDIFTNGVPPFHRILPTATSGQPVPPPFYDLYVRVRDGATANAPVVSEISRRVYVPQVVKIIWNDTAAEFLSQPQYLRVKNFSTNLYAGCSLSTAQQLLSAVPSMVSERFPANSNLRVVGPNTVVQGDQKQVLLVANANPENDPLGKTLDFSFPNCDCNGIANVNLLSISNTLYRSYYWFITGNEGFEDTSWQSISLPLTSNSLLCFMTGVAVHETGHLLGLVSDTYLCGIALHNGFINGQYFMNRGELTNMGWRFEVQDRRNWYWRNNQYLHFILPMEAQR